MQIPDKKTDQPLEHPSSRNGYSYAMLVAGLVVIGLGAGWFVFAYGDEGRGSVDLQTDPIAEASTLYPVTIRKVAGPPRVDTGLKDAEGNRVEVACATCHATRTPNRENKQSADLNEFHTGWELVHGQISCLSCHNPDDYDSLKLADGSRVEFTDVMTLCAQCHGQQMTDYEHNVHGGMSGYWDLSRGPRVKNNCVDCHNPHTPQFPKMQPTFKPRDRFLEPHGQRSGEEANLRH